MMLTVMNMMMSAPRRRATTTLSVDDFWHQRSQHGRLWGYLVWSIRFWDAGRSGSVEGEVITATLVWVMNSWLSKGSSSGLWECWEWRQSGGLWLKRGCCKWKHYFRLGIMIPMLTAWKFSKLDAQDVEIVQLQLDILELDKSLSTLEKEEKGLHWKIWTGRRLIGQSLRKSVAQYCS